MNEKTQRRLIEIGVKAIAAVAIFFVVTKDFKKHNTKGKRRTK